MLHHLVQGEALHGDRRDRQVLGQLLARPQVKAAIDHRNDDGETALYLAMQARELDDACATLLEHGATINASHPAEFGPHAGEAKLNEWQLLIDKPWGRSATVRAYIRAQATNAAEAHFCLNSLQTVGLGKSAASLGRVREAMAWVEVGMEQFCAHPNNDPALIDKLQNTALGYLRWSTLGDTTLPKDVWLAERGPLAFGMMQAFERGDCQLLSGAIPPAMQWCLQHDMAGLAAELERQQLSQATPDALHPSNAAAHRL